MLSLIHNGDRIVVSVPLRVKCLCLTDIDPAVSGRVVEFGTLIGWINRLTELKL